MSITRKTNDGTNRNLHFVSRLWLLTIVAFAMTAFACGPDFDDPSMSRVKKPELLSIVLDPPEAAPGDTVTASFLLADQFGPVEDKLNFWLPTAPGSSDFASDASDSGSVVDIENVLADSGLDMMDLISPRLEYIVPREEDYAFDSFGMSPQMFSLLVQVGELDLSRPEALMEDMESLIRNGDVKMAYRTLIVSNREFRNTNPRVTELRMKFGGEEQDVSWVPFDDPSPSASRRKAAGTPVIVKEYSSVLFTVEVEDENETDLENAIRYQWISNAGDFGSRREKKQEWIAPFYVPPIGADQDQSKSENPDFRKDPNLHAAWLILRDNGVENQLGQSWVEFYIRVVRAD